MKTQRVKSFMHELENHTKHYPAKFTKVNFNEIMGELHGFHSSNGLWFASIKDDYTFILIIKVEDWKETSMSNEIHFRVVDYSLLHVSSFASAIVAISGNTDNYKAVESILRGEKLGQTNI